MTDRTRIGTYIGAGIAAAGLASAAVALWPRRAEGIDLEGGIVPGYNSHPGDAYQVYRKTPEGVMVIAEPLGVWFDDPEDQFRCVYDSLRSFGLPVGGALVGVGHSVKAGIHSTGRRATMKGYNLWGVKGGGGWYNDGKPFFTTATEEADSEGVYYHVDAAKWRWYGSMKEATENWLTVMNNWPDAKAELYRKDPDPERYQAGLESGKYHYATGSADMSDVVAWALENVPPALHGAFGYNFG